MEPILIMKTACALLGIAALGGLTMAGIRFGGKPQPPTWLAMLHGLLPLPKGLIVGHAGVAVVGFVLLLAATWAATHA